MLIQVVHSHPLRTATTTRCSESLSRRSGAARCDRNGFLSGAFSRRHDRSGAASYYQGPYAEEEVSRLVGDSARRTASFFAFRTGGFDAACSRAISIASGRPERLLPMI